MPLFNFKIRKALDNFEKMIEKPEYCAFKITSSATNLRGEAQNVMFTFFINDYIKESIAVSDTMSFEGLEALMKVLLSNEYFRNHYIPVMSNNEHYTLMENPGLLGSCLRQYNGGAEFLHGKKIRGVCLIEPKIKGSYNCDCSCFNLMTEFYDGSISFQTLERIISYFEKHFSESKQLEYMKNVLNENFDIELHQYKYQLEKLNELKEKYFTMEWGDMNEFLREKYRVVLESEVKIKNKIKALPEEKRLIFETL